MLDTEQRTAGAEGKPEEVFYKGTTYLFAEMAEKKTSLCWVQRAVGAVRTWLRENIPGLRAMKMSDGERITNFIPPRQPGSEGGWRHHDAA